MLKIASFSGAPTQKTPLTTLPQTPLSREASSLQQSQLRAFGARNLTYCHILIGTQTSRSQFSPPGSPYSIPGSDPYMRSLELTNYEYFCIVCPPVFKLQGDWGLNPLPHLADPPTSTQNL